MGDISTTVMYFFLIVLLLAYVGANIFTAVTTEEQIDAYRTSTHSIALDIANMISLTGIATDDIYLDYEIEPKLGHQVNIEKRVVTVTRCKDNERCGTDEELKKRPSFKFSVPFDFSEMKIDGSDFRISRELDESGNNKYRISAR